MQPLKVQVAIIGAGVSGSLIANLLSEAGLGCALFEKSRGMGGRCSRRLVADGFSVDLGAPAFSLQSIQQPQLRRKLDDWLQHKYLSQWQHRTCTFDEPQNIASSQMFSAEPTLNSWHKNITAAIPTRTGVRVQSLQRSEGYWLLRDEQQQLIAEAEQLVVTAPPEQAAALFQSADHMAFAQHADIPSLPQYIAVIALPEGIKLPADVYCGGHNILAAAVRESSKPGRNETSSEGDIWLLHSTFEWAQQQQHQAASEVAVHLIEQFRQQLDLSVMPTLLSSHYWRLARALPAAQPMSCLWDDSQKLGCCADWLSSGDVAGALNSAFALSQKMLATEN